MNSRAPRARPQGADDPRGAVPNGPGCQENDPRSSSNVEKRRAPRQTTHYDTLGIDAAASVDDIIGAAAVPPTGVTPQQVQATVSVLTSPRRHEAYDQQAQAGDPDGSDSDDDDVTDGALTLADVREENPALHDFVVAIYGQYLPSTEPEQVIGFHICIIHCIRQ
eukprot:COSAG06_NODE_7318_length_2547_cov_11.542075_3_plen_165_part_00